MTDERPVVDVLQTWIVLGVPGVVVAAALFVGSSRVRAWLGYGVLAGLVAVFVGVPGGGPSAAVIGAVIVVLIATGRGTHADRDVREHHELRRRFTTTGG